MPTPQPGTPGLAPLSSPVPNAAREWLSPPCSRASVLPAEGPGAVLGQAAVYPQRNDTLTVFL